MTDRDTRTVLLHRASRLIQTGRIVEAIAAHEELLALYPELPDSWYNLAYLQRHARRFDAALASYQEALNRKIAQPEEVHLNRGAIFTDHLGRSDLAETELRAALAGNPDYVPALLNLGNLYEDRGDRSQATEIYERCLAIEPANAVALSRLAGLSIFEGPDHSLINRLQQAINSRGLSSEDKALLGFALGQALDEAGDYDRAFTAYEEANRASRASAGPRRNLYDAGRQEQLIDRLIQSFPQSVTHEAGHHAKPPVFICGMFRSGSTLIEHILASHPNVTAGGELDLLPALVRDELQPYPEKAGAADTAMLDRMREKYLEGIRTIHPDAGLLTDKRPDNFLHIGLIKRLFPDARIIHTRRDPIDNCLSIYFLHLSHQMPYALDLMDTAHWYLQYRRLMAHWKALYPADILDVDYDVLVADPEPALKRVTTFCGLEWNDACLSFHENTSQVKTASAWQVRKPLYRRSSGRWINYKKHLGALRSTLEKLEKPNY